MSWASVEGKVKSELARYDTKRVEARFSRKIRLGAQAGG